MAVNVRISDEIYGKLKGYADGEMRSIANAVEYLINSRIDEINRNKTTLTSPEKLSDEQDEKDEGWIESNPPRKAEKLPCCLGNKPCKHWVWDMNTGNGYVNTITGEVKEV